MLSDRVHSIDAVPVLSRGKHRSPRKGACFMELASYLAGERWTDHPACTHPLLAELARQVNDHVSDEARQTLLGLVPDVIGVTGSDLRIDLRIALRAARTALPVVSEEWQRVMAVGVLSCERLLADLDGRPGTALSRQSQAVLALAPGAAKHRFVLLTSHTTLTDTAQLPDQHRDVPDGLRRQHRQRRGKERGEIVEVLARQQGLADGRAVRR
jgi:hypothetical protein